MENSCCYEHSQATKGPNSGIERETIRIDKYQLPLPVFVTNMPKGGMAGFAAANDDQSANRVMSPYNDEEVLNGIEAVIHTLEDSTEALKHANQEVAAKVSDGVLLLSSILRDVRDAIKSLPSAGSSPKKAAPTGWCVERLTYGASESRELKVGFPVGLVRVTDSWGVPMMIYVDGELVGIIPAGGGERKVAAVEEASIVIVPAFKVEEHWAAREFFVELEGV